MTAAQNLTSCPLCHAPGIAVQDCDCLFYPGCNGEFSCPNHYYFNHIKGYDTYDEAVKAWGRFVKRQFKVIQDKADSTLSLFKEVQL